MEETVTHFNKKRGRRDLEKREDDGERPREDRLRPPPREREWRPRPAAYRSPMVEGSREYSDESESSEGEVSGEGNERSDGGERRRVELRPESIENLIKTFEERRNYMWVGVCVCSCGSVYVCAHVVVFQLGTVGKPTLLGRACL